MYLATVRAESDVLPYVLLVAPIVCAVSAIILVVLWLRHRGESAALAERALVSVLLTLSCLGWAVLVGSSFLGVKVPIDLSTETVAASVLMPAFISVLWVALYVTDRFSG